MANIPMSRAIPVLVAVLSVFFLLNVDSAHARTKSYFILDVTSGRLIDEVNSEKKLHPASLTKMMTLYLAFEALQQGKLSLDSQIVVSRHAAAMEPSKVGFKVGQTVTFNEVIHAAAVKSANDAAVVIAEAVAGTEWGFAQRMTQRAYALGMRDTTFKNASGLTAPGHLSTTRDMAILGMRLFRDFPQHYGIFAKKATNYRGRTLLASNRRFLKNYRGADGIKTGYTRAAGFNLVSSAERDGKRVIVSYFGADSSAARNARVSELMDQGFAKAVKGSRSYANSALVAQVNIPAQTRITAAPLPVRVPMRKQQKPVAIAGNIGTPANTQQTASLFSLGQSKTIQKTQLDTHSSLPAGPTPTQALPAAPVVIANNNQPTVQQPQVKPTVITTVKTTLVPLSEKEQSLFSRSLGSIQQAIVPNANARVAAYDTVQRNGNWGIQLGAFREQEQAQNHLHQALITAKAHLDKAYRAIDPHTSGRQTLYRARFTGLSQDTAKTACRDLSAQGMNCVAVPPESW